jgi:hypothetical protein
VPLPWKVAGSTDFDGDGRHDIFWFNSSTGQTSIWFMNGTEWPGAYVAPAMATGWRPEHFGDYNGDAKGDVFLRNASTGQTRVWLMNVTTIGAQGDLYNVPSPWRVLTP